MGQTPPLAALPSWAVRVRAERTRRGWSRQVMADVMRRSAGRLGVASPHDPRRLAEYLKRWERGGVRAPDATHQLTLATTLGLTVSELFGELAAPAVMGQPRVGSADNIDLPHYADAEENPMQRRRFLAWLAALSAGSVALPASVGKTIAVAGQQPDTLPVITADDVQHLRATTQMFDAWDHRVGGGLSRHAVNAQLGWAVHQLDVQAPTSPTLHSRWRVATALLAGLAGFKNYDAGHEQEARSLFVLGYRLAAEADDRPVQAAALYDMAQQAVYLGRPRTGLDLARHGLELSDDASPITRSMLHAMKARAYARLGDSQRLSREIGMAEEEYAQTRPDDRLDEPWLDYYDATELASDTGTAWHIFAWHHGHRANDRPMTEATTRLSAAASGYGTEWVRSRALCNLMRATITMKAGEPDTAAATAMASLPDVAQLHSARVDDHLHDLRRAAASYQRRPDVRNMLDSIATV